MRQLRLINADMTDIQSRILIIDASVARAAGGIDAVNPASMRCSEFLTAVYDICHTFGMTHGIKQEWDKHASSFTSTWLKNMVSKGKLKPISSIKNSSLRGKIAADISAPKTRKAMEKDAILIEAAMGAHGVVVSLDETARELFQDFSLRADELNGICWVNPTTESETPIHWLQAGALSEKNRTFEYRRKTKAKTRQEKRQKR